MKTPFTAEQDLDYALGMLKVWKLENNEILRHLQGVETTTSLAQIKLKRVIREMSEVSEMIEKNVKANA